MKIVADENIPLVNEYFGSFGEITLKPGRAIKQEDLINADILLVRAVTPVNANLLQHTSVKFVGSVTAGADHLDTLWLDQANIRWSVAAGCNAIAVAEYVVCLIAFLQKNDFLRKDQLRAAVIGVGHAGQQVVDRLKILGFDVIQCDPLRKEKEPDFPSVPLEEIRDVDLISLHVPLTTTGWYPTHHFIKKDFLQRQKNNSVLINTSRGEVIQSNHLKCIGQRLIWCLDVFEHEPFIDMAIWQSALIATPHIAGYSLQSKYRGIEMIYQAAIKNHIISSSTLKNIPLPSQQIDVSHHTQTLDWQEVALALYDPFITSQHMKKALLEDANAFDQLRKDFILRNEFAYSSLKNIKLDEKDSLIVRRLGMLCC